MKITLEIDGQEYVAEWDHPVDLSIRLDNWPAQPNAFYAPPYSKSPYVSGDFIGSIEKGAPVNFFNIALNPHGNGTHTECAAHILDLNWSVTDSVGRLLCVADLVSVYPELLEEGDRCIRRETLARIVGNGRRAEALIIRTLPNPEDKKIRKYSGGNPPYFDVDAMQWIREQGYLHLLTDLPSVDREEDGGNLAAHHCFWETDMGARKDKTITELIFVDKEVEDGLYVLNLQLLNIALDASPSRPVIYKLKKKTAN